MMNIYIIIFARARFNTRLMKQRILKRDTAEMNTNYFGELSVA